MEEVGVGEASSSSATSSCRFTHNVFLSFSGEDTPKGFTDNLCSALERKGITAFRNDKELERDDAISSELLRAIEESMFAIIVLSPNYASSTRCLEEIRKIVECKKNKGLMVVPFFYGMEPSDVRRQQQLGSFEGAFRKHEELYDSKKINQWKDALAQIANYPGWSWNSKDKDQHEEKIVEVAENICWRHMRLSETVGISSRVEEVIRLIGIGLDDVRFVGIWGMGGIGKTTIARAVYDVIRGEFQVSCFVYNVNELYQRDGLRNILSYLNESSCDFSDVEEGRIILKNSFCNKKVLLVLDDVMEEDQLKNLTCNQDWFGPGSRIIITTRDRDLLNRHGVHGTYEVNLLNQEEALRLFCLKAFKQDEPIEGHSNLYEEVVEYTQGLPLAVVVLCSLLRGRNVEFWGEFIRKNKRSQLETIFRALKLSYDHLLPTEKNIFLDIACFFNGMDRDKITHILKMCYQSVGIESGLASLIDKSLVTLDQNNKLEMHKLIQDMGRQVAYLEYSTDPGKRSRLWSMEDINWTIRSNVGTAAIKGIGLSQDYACYKSDWSTCDLSNTRGLKFLHIYGIELPHHGFKSLPNSLRYLHWMRCPLKTLPLPSQRYELVQIELSYSKIEQLWHGTKILENLKYMDLSHCWYLKQTLDLSAAPVLETFILEDCSDLTEIHSSLVHHKNLVLLNLSKCTNLKTLPGTLEMSSLKELILTDCWSFENLPEFGECMKHLSRLCLEGTAIRKLPTSLGSLFGLSDLNLDHCKTFSFDNQESV